MASPLVSVCIPCHNAAPYVGQAIESVLSQSWPKIEIILVDDGSTDGSIRVCKRYESATLRVIPAAFGSASKSRNRALSEAQGELIKFLDADDLLSPGAIEAQVRRLGERSDAVATSRWGRFYGENFSTFQLNSQSVWRDMNATDWLVEAWYGAQPMMQPGMFLIPRAMLNQSGGWDETLSLIDDFEFFARLLCHASEVLFVPESTLYYRSGLPGSLSGRNGRRAWESALHSLLRGTDHLLQRRNDPQARLSCANVLQNFIYSVYPNHPDLRNLMQRRIAELGGSDLAMPAGPRLQALQRLVGWKAAKRLQKFAGRA